MTLRGPQIGMLLLDHTIDALAHHSIGPSLLNPRSTAKASSAAPADEFEIDIGGRLSFKMLNRRQYPAYFRLRGYDFADRESTWQDSGRSSWLLRGNPAEDWVDAALYLIMICFFARTCTLALPQTAAK